MLTKTALRQPLSQHARLSFVSRLAGLREERLWRLLTTLNNLPGDCVQRGRPFSEDVFWRQQAVLEEIGRRFDRWKNDAA